MTTTPGNARLLSSKPTPGSGAISELLTEHDVARITGMSVASVRRWRLLGQGPRFLKLTSAVRYRQEDLAVWLETRPVGGQLTEEK